MLLAKNSVWKISNSDLTADGHYRVLDVMQNVESVFLFYLDNESREVRPFAVSLEMFREGYKTKQIIEAVYNLPPFLLIAEEHIPTEHIIRRDKNYRLITPLVNDREFLFDYATKKRTTKLAEYALSADINKRSLCRLLTNYWRYGQNISACLPAFSNSGGVGKAKKSTDKPLGAPKQPRTLAIKRSEKYIVSSLDKDKFRKAIKKYYLKQPGLTLAKTYKNLLKDSYAYELKIADAYSRPPLVPTSRQFSYWVKTNLDRLDITQARTTENDYVKNKRGLLGSVIQDSFLPGSHFEIDATVADVHIVSELGSSHILGRPTIYLVIDRASRMIVGMHVSLYHASWRAARQALFNSFLAKKAYCKEFGIEIDDSQWPCYHIPNELVCDNGEMIGLKPQETLTPMTRLSFAPPYRPDCKGVVEKRFDILNNEVIHEFLGTTRGGNVIRGTKDPRKDAALTLKEVSKEIIKAVLEHNRSIFDDLAFSSPLVIGNDLAPTPLNYWKIHVAKHQHELQVATESEVIRKLLPPAEVSMTRSGIYFNGLYYSCNEIEESSLASQARTNGQWRLPARIDENTTNCIYVQLTKHQPFTRCYLLPRSRMLRDKSMYESEFIQDWLDSKKELVPVSVTSIEDHQERQKVVKEAKRRIKDSNKHSFSERTKTIRKHRAEELAATTNMLDTKDSNNLPDNAEQNIQLSRVIPLPVGRKRRAKDEQT